MDTSPTSQTTMLTEQEWQTMVEEFRELAQARNTVSVEEFFNRAIRLPAPQLPIQAEPAINEELEALAAISEYDNRAYYAARGVWLNSTQDQIRYWLENYTWGDGPCVMLGWLLEVIPERDSDKRYWQELWDEYCEDKE